MPSPFPGMDPYLEDPFVWHQFYSRLIVALANDLGIKLRPEYYATIGTRTYLEDGLDVVLVDIPDGIGCSGTLAVDPSYRQTATIPMPTAQPQKVRLVEPIEVKERYLEIRKVGSKEVIATIEVLSPKNKRGEGREVYLKRRQGILKSTSHFVEIDLLRVAQSMRVEGAAGKSDYRILVSAASNRPNADLYRFNLRDAIPVFPLPLRSADESVPVDLGMLLQEIYDQGCLDLHIEYHQPVPAPTLSAEDAAWVKEVVRSQP
jgi:Protein of unknown function (DUF4058)